MMGHGKGIRRIVTGHNDKGRAVLLCDAPVMGRELFDGAACFFEIWKTMSNPVDNDDATDRTGGDVGLTQAGGSVIRVVDMAPGSRSPMHRSNSLDYGIVVAGQIDLELDDDISTRVNAGEIVVQRGTIHAWVNRGPTTARVVFVLLDANAATCRGSALPPVDP